MATVTATFAQSTPLASGVLDKSVQTWKRTFTVAAGDVTALQAITQPQTGPATFGKIGEPYKNMQITSMPIVLGDQGIPAGGLLDVSDVFYAFEPYRAVAMQDTLRTTSTTYSWG